MTERKLSEQQKRFLDNLFDPAFNGNYRKAATAAGYSTNRSMTDLLPPLRDEILRRVKDAIIANTPKALLTVVGTMDNPERLGARDALNAAKDILDRGGAVHDAVTNLGGGGLFIMPAKDVSIKS